MELNEDEKRRIYEEEKARLEIREKAEKELKKKKWTFGRITKYAVGAFLAIFLGIPFMLGFFGAMADKSGNQAETTEAETTEAQAPAESGNIVTVDYGNKKVKAALVDETLHLVERIEHRHSIGDEFTKQTADGEFLIVRLLVRNDSKKTRTIGASQMSVINAAGQEFQTSSEGGTALVMSGDKSAEFLMTQVQPGLEKRIAVVFDVPPGSKNLQLKVPSGGFGEGAVLPL